MVEARRAGAAGTGLGLSFCRLAVEAQGGHIRLASGEGQGTTIVFTLPTTKKPAA
jgi:signal transduction histidine kinase